MIAAAYCTEKAFHWSQLLHPLCGNGYQGWSGILSDIGEYTIAVTVLAGFAAWWRKHNCHVHRCPRLQWHVHPEHGHPVCSTHHPDHPKHHRASTPHFLKESEHRYP